MRNPHWCQGLFPVGSAQCFGGSRWHGVGSGAVPTRACVGGSSSEVAFCLASIGEVGRPRNSEKWRKNWVCPAKLILKKKIYIEWAPALTVTTFSHVKYVAYLS